MKCWRHRSHQYEKSLFFPGWPWTLNQTHRSSQELAFDWPHFLNILRMVHVEPKNTSKTGNLRRPLCCVLYFMPQSHICQGAPPTPMELRLLEFLLLIDDERRVRLIGKKKKSVSVEYMWKPTKIGRCGRHENQPQLEGERRAGETVQGKYIELVEKADLNQNKMTDAVVEVTVCREVRMVSRAETLSDFYAFLSGWFFSKHE